MTMYQTCQKTSGGTRRQARFLRNSPGPLYAAGLSNSAPLSMTNTGTAKMPPMSNTMASDPRKVSRASGSMALSPTEWIVTTAMIARTRSQEIQAVEAPVAGTGFVCPDSRVVGTSAGSGGSTSRA